MHRKPSYAMKDNDTMKVAAISVMATHTPSLEGYLGKWPTQSMFQHRKFQERYFVLSAYYLAYYTSKPFQLEQDPEGVFDLRGVMARIAIDNDDTAKACFEIVLTSSQDNQTLKLRGRSAENAQLWVSGINHASTIVGLTAESNGNGSSTTGASDANGVLGLTGSAIASRPVVMQGYLRQKLPRTMEWEKFYVELHRSDTSAEIHQFSVICCCLLQSLCQLSRVFNHLVAGCFCQR